MARIMIENMFEMTLSASDLSRTMLQHFQDQGLDWMHACGGKGRCTTCRVRVTQGGENLQPLTGAERRYREIGALRDDERLACQARILADVSVSVPEDCKLPHVRYSGDDNN